MPVFEITAPDGKKFRVTGPDGSTKEEALIQVQKSYKPTAAAPEQLATPVEAGGKPVADPRAAGSDVDVLEKERDAPDTSTSRADAVLPQGKLRERGNVEGFLRSPLDFLDSLQKGVIKGVGGPIQTLADAFASPNAAQKVTDTLEALSNQKGAMTQAIDYLMGGKSEANHYNDQAAEFVGQMLPYVMFPESAAAKAASVPARLLRSATMGGVAGGTSFQEGKTASERNEGRIESAAVGATLGPAATLAGAGLVEVSHSRALTKGINTIKNWVNESDPALREVRVNLNEPVAKAKAELEQRSLDLARYEDHLGPIPLKDEEGFLRTLSDKAASLKGIVSDPLLKSVQDMLGKIAPQFVEPPVIKGSKGFEYVRIKPGVYQLQGAKNPLPKVANDALLDSYRRKNPLTTTFTSVKAAVESLDEALSKSKTSDTSSIRATAIELRDSLKDKLEQWSTPQLTRLHNDFNVWREQHYEPLMADALKPVLEAPDAVTRANALLKIGLGKEAGVARTAAGLVGEKGREAVFRGATKKALDASWDAETGQHDAAKFAAFFRDKEGLKPFMDEKTKTLVRGLENYLSDKALRTGVAPKFKVPRFERHALSYFPGLTAMVSGRIKEGLTEMAAVAASRPLFAVTEHLLNDTFGRNLLAAAAVAKPGSPRMGRIAQTIATRFAGPAAATGAAEAEGE
jgi:hypothetical protein